MDENKKIKTDIFEYDKAYSAYKSSTPRYTLGPLYIQILLNQLKDTGYICHDHNPVIIGDICCGASETIIDYLRNVDFQSGFDIRGVDTNPEYTGYKDTELITTCDMQLKSQIDGLAEVNLAKAKQSQIIPLKHYQIRHGDVLNGDLAQLLLTKDEISQKTAPFRLIFLSHCAYYFVKGGQESPQQFINFIDKLNSDLLAQDGIIILLHSTLEPNSFCVLEAKFSFNHLKDIITPTAKEYNQFSSDAIIRSTCQQLGLKCFEISYFSPLYFSQYLSQYADVFKDPSRYNELLSNKDALQDLYCILFMAHRSPQNLYQDVSSNGLTNLVDQTVKMAQPDGHLNGRIAIQIIPSKNASQQFIQRLEAIVNDINNSQLTK